MTITIHHLQVSQSEGIVWLAEELGLDYKLVIHKRDPFLSPQSVKDINVLGQAPVIQDGDITLAESGAITDYILQKYGGGRLAMGPSHPAFAQYLYWFHFANGNLQPQATRAMVLKHGGANRAGFHFKHHVGLLARFMQFMDDHLRDNQWLVGDTFTAADVMNVFPLTTMRTFSGEDISAYGNILRYLKDVSSRAGYQNARLKGDPELPLMISGEPPAQFLDKIKLSI